MLMEKSVSARRTDAARRFDGEGERGEGRGWMSRRLVCVGDRRARWRNNAGRKKGWKWEAKKEERNKRELILKGT